MPGPIHTLDDIETILFDLDGTLADTISLIVESFRHATRTVLGEPLPDSLVLENLGRPLAEYLGHLAPGRAEELIRVYREHNLAHHDALVREYPGVREALAELSVRGFGLGVVTSKGRELAARGLGALDLGGLFDVVVCLEDTQRHKPDPDPLLCALRASGTAPARAAYVGDSPWDVMAGRAAGVRTVAVTWGGFGRDELTAAGPDVAVERPSDLLEVFVSPARRARPAGERDRACVGTHGLGKGEG